MHLILVGLSHRTAPIELRERVDFQSRLEAALRAIAERGSTPEAAVLYTPRYGTTPRDTVRRVAEVSTTLFFFLRRCSSTSGPT